MVICQSHCLDYFPFSLHGKLMYSYPPGINNAIPSEYQQAAEALFPPEGFSKDALPSVEAAAGFAEILGIGSDYQKILNAENPQITQKFFGHFQNNLDLLIQKTWVEKSDENRKQKLQTRIPGFIKEIEAENYQRALVEFGGVLDELAYLFFGTQSNKEDFIEYALRIDTQMGLFWWYGSQIGKIQSPGEKSNKGIQPETPGVPEGIKDCFKALLFIGMCYLTNF